MRILALISALLALAAGALVASTPVKVQGISRVTVDPSATFFDPELDNPMVPDDKDAVPARKCAQAPTTVRLRATVPARAVLIMAPSPYIPQAAFALDEPETPAAPLVESRKLIPERELLRPDMNLVTRKLSLCDEMSWSTELRLSFPAPMRDFGRLRSDHG
jgi:hypothetical protein